MSYRPFVLLLIIGSMLLFPGVTAVDPDIKITGTPEWVVAGNANTATITVQVLDNGTAMKDTPVVLKCLNSLGTISSASSLTDDDGFITFTFTPKTISGNALLEATVTYTDPINGTSSKSNQSEQKIDHNVPKYFGQVIYPASETVATDLTITVRLKDRYGNLVDSKREDFEGRSAELLTFSDSPDGNGGFLDPFNNLVHRISKQVDTSGNASVTYTLPTRAGDNILQITAPSGVVSNVTNANYMWIIIKGTPSTPIDITSYVKTPPYDMDPAPPNLAVANGEDIFQIYYTVYDDYRNPVPSVKVYWESFNIDTQKTEYKELTTNYQGIVYLEVGPTTELQKIRVTADLDSTFNGQIAVEDDLRFVTGGPAIFEAYANPVLLASRDANNESIAVVRAHLMDNMGRGIVGEVVTFEIINDIGSPINPLNLSSFSENIFVQTSTAITDNFGYATVTFYPGTFPDEFSDDFVENATGVASILASWTNVSLNLSDQDSISITYKNYPYLRVETFVNPTQVDVNKTVNITLLLTGDGYAPHLPIDIMLCNSRAEPMLKDMQYMGNNGAVEDKMVYVHQVTDDFTYQFRSKKDRIGIVTFGIDQPTFLTQSSGFRLPGIDNEYDDDEYIVEYYPAHIKEYDDYATVDVRLTDPQASNMTLLRDEIKEMTPSKDPAWLPPGKYLSPIRYGLYTAINELNTTPGTGERVKAVILLTDRAWSQAGDPIARNPSKGKTLLEMPLNDTTWSNGGKSDFTIFEDLGDMYSPLQNMSNYALASSVRIYVVAYPEKGNSINIDDVATFTLLSNSTGGRFFTANSVNELKSIYSIIAEELRKYAGADTSMSLDFSNTSLSYNNVSSEYSGNEVFGYEFEENVSTQITSWNVTHPLIKDKLPVPPYPSTAIPGPVSGNITYPYSLDQRSEWAAHDLLFYAGNISIGQTWQAKFRLKALKPGLINLFGNSSSICFNSIEGSDCIQLPETYVTVILNLSAPIEDQPGLDIIDNSLNATPSGTEEILNVTWTLNYTSANFVQQNAYYQFSSDGSTWSEPWVVFDTNITGGEPIDHKNYSLILDVREMVGYIKVKIFSFEIPLGGVDDTEISQEPIPVGHHRASNIKIS